MKLSVVIPNINDPEINSTIASIRATAGGKVEVVCVDDCSSTRPVIHGADKVVFNRFRAGAGACRHIGALAATGTHLLLCDSHMRFTPGWHEAATERIKDRPATVHCAICLGLDSTNMDVRNPNGEYFGATFNFLGKDRKGAFQIFESVWKDNVEGDDYELPSVMGANYFWPKEFFLKLAPLKYLRSWGGEESIQALKCWLSVGEIRLMKTVRIGHKFKIEGQKLPFSAPFSHIIYNKLFTILTCMPEKEAAVLISKFPKDQSYNKAWELIRADWHLVAAEQEYNRTIFTKEFSWFIDKFQLQFPHG